jgi:hypothetical protein
MRNRRSLAGVGPLIAAIALMGLVPGAGHASVGQRALEESFGFSFGEPGDFEFAQAVAPVPGGTVVGGYVDPEATAENPTPPYVGTVTRFGASGQQVWEDRFSSGRVVRVEDVAASSSAVVAAGIVSGSLTGEPVAGDYDAFVRWYTADGALVRQFQFGVGFDPETAPHGADSAQAVALAEGSLYVGGYTQGSLDGPDAGESDAFVRKYAADGTLVWARQFGTAAVDGVSEIKADGDRIHVAGFTKGALSGAADPDGDVFVAELSADTGEPVWTRQVGTPLYDQVEAFDVGATHLYVGGVTAGVFPGTSASGGQRDGWVASFDLTGALEWVRQLDTAAEIRGLAAARPGVVAAGFTSGIVAEGYAGTGDLFVRAYDDAGGPVWTRQFGGEPERGEIIEDAAAAPNGVYIAGYGNGGLFGGEVGPVDSFVARFSLHQPDSMAGHAGEALVGADTYAPQQLSTASASVARGAVTRFRVVTQNDGEVASAFRIRGCGDRSGVRVRYFVGSREITAAVRDGWRTPILRVGERQGITVRVRVLVDAELGPRSCQVVSHSADRRIGLDRVALSIRVVRD